MVRVINSRGATDSLWGGTFFEPIRETGLRQSNQRFNLALSGHSKIFVRKPHVRAVWGRRVSKYSMVLGVEVEVWMETATGVLERLVGHCLGGMWFLNAVGPLSSPVSRALECAVPAFLPGKKRTDMSRSA